MRISFYCSRSLSAAGVSFLPWKMERPLGLLVSLVLVSFCRGQGWTAPDYCHQQSCPNFTPGETHQDFEERFYVATEWISTKIASSQISDVMAAHSRLKAYCNRQEDAGNPIPYSWPVLITVTSGSNYSLSWFIPPGTTMSEDTDPSVTVQSRPAATVYVRVFDSSPSIQSGEDNAKTLRESLVKAGKAFDPNTYSGAAYDSYFAFVHHNEIWIRAA